MSVGPDPYDEIREVLLEVCVDRNTAAEAFLAIKDIIADEADSNRRVNEFLGRHRPSIERTKKELWEPLLYATNLVLQSMNGGVYGYLGLQEDQDDALWMLGDRAIDEVLGLDSSIGPRDDDDEFERKAELIVSCARKYLTAVLMAAERGIKKGPPLKGRKRYFARHKLWLDVIECVWKHVCSLGIVGFDDRGGVPVRSIGFFAPSRGRQDIQKVQAQQELGFLSSKSREINAKQALPIFRS